MQPTHPTHFCRNGYANVREAWVEVEIHNYMHLVLLVVFKWNEIQLLGLIPIRVLCA